MYCKTRNIWIWLNVLKVIIGKFPQKLKDKIFVFFGLRLHKEATDRLLTYILLNRFKVHVREVKKGSYLGILIFLAICQEMDLIESL